MGATKPLSALDFDVNCAECCRGYFAVASTPHINMQSSDQELLGLFAPTLLITCYAVRQDNNPVYSQLVTFRHIIGILYSRVDRGAQPPPCT